MAETSCVEPSKGVISTEETSQEKQEESKIEKEEIKMIARVGKKAPDFELTAYHKGEFKNVKLSDYDGQWRLLCFYPGDFTFV